MRFRSLSIVASTLAAASLAVGSAHAQEPTKATSPTPSAKALEAQRLELLKAVRSGASDAEVEKRTGLKKVGKLISNPEAAPQSTLALTSADPDPSDLSVQAPNFYYDPSNQTYSVITGAYIGITPETGYDHAVGGRDGIGLRFSRPIQNLGGNAWAGSTWSGNTASPYPAEWELTNYFANSQYGVSWSLQDRHADFFANGNYGAGKNAAYIDIVFSMKTLDSQCIQAFSNYAHTWSSTGITGFGVGPYSFSVSWSSDSHVIQRASDGGSESCG